MPREVVNYVVYSRQSGLYLEFWPVGWTEDVHSAKWWTFPEGSAEMIERLISRNRAENSAHGDAITRKVRKFIQIEVTDYL